MELELFVKNFAAQFDEIESDTLTAATNFKDIDEWDSMVALSIIAMVDEEYSVKITGNDIKGAQTISDLYSVVSSKKQQSN